MITVNLHASDEIQLNEITSAMFDVPGGGRVKTLCIGTVTIFASADQLRRIAAVAAELAEKE